MTFEGFPDDALAFYEGLSADNSKAYWEDHRATYDSCVAAPMKELLAALEPSYGPAKFFRPYRDVRFSKDKTPYKTQAAAAVEGGEGALYVALSADGLFVAGGMYAASSDQVQRFRAAVGDDRTGAALDKILKRLTSGGWELGGEQLKRTPKPWDDTHPRAGLLRRKGLTAHRAYEPDEWLHTPAVLNRVSAGWKALAPLNGWLHQHVGPSR